MLQLYVKDDFGASKQVQNTWSHFVKSKKYRGISSVSSWTWLRWWKHINLPWKRSQKVKITARFS